MPTAVLFPGQGAQVPDLRERVAAARPDLLERCIALVGEDPFPRITESTRFAQPAILCGSLAAGVALDADVVAVAGHSLGELAALVAAGALDEDDALALVVERGRLMAEAGGGTMLALLGADPARATAIALAHGVVVANDNAPGQVVLSGDEERLKAVRRDAKAEGLRSLPLGVAGAFHSPAMEPAVEPFRAALAGVAFRAPRVPVVSGLTARPMEDPRADLADALTGAVHFRGVLERLWADGARTFVDAGPGTVIAGLVRRTLPDATVRAHDEELAGAPS
jgi:acyl transferase domain-containing protein